jgi:hypothetical protein
MRKILLLMAVLLPLSLFGMNDENEKVVMKIPLELDLEEKLNRLLIPVPIESYCYVMMNTIITNVFSDLGEISLTVTNHSTGEVWYDIFDSGVQSQLVTKISGVQGCYEIIYVTASEDVYRGLFEIN